MNILGLLTFFCFLAYLYIGIYLYRLDKRSVLNRLFLAICFSTAIWALTFTFMLMAEEARYAMMWRRISTIGWGMLYAFLLHFFLVFTKKRTLLEKWWIYPLNYLPALAFVILFTSDYYISNSTVKQTDLGWVFIDPEPKIFAYLFMLYYTLIVISVTLLTWNWGYKSKLRRHKKQARLIVVTFIIALVLGAVTDGILPATGVETLPPLAIVFILIPALGIWYSIRRYRLVAFSKEMITADLLRTMGEGLVMVSSEGRIKLINHSALKMLGFEEKELLHEPVEILFDNSRLSLSILEQKADQSGGYHSFATTLYANSGSRIPVLLSATMMHDEWKDKIGMICTFQDITHRIKADESLAYERAHFEHLFHSAPVGIVLLDNNDHVINCNKEFTRLFQFTEEDAKGKPINDLIVPVFLKNEASGLSTKIAKGESLYHESVRIRKDGEPVDVAITGKPIIVKEGQIAIYGIYQDISERKKSEIELKQRLAFQENVVKITARFASTLDVDAAISESLDEIGRVSNADRSYLFMIDTITETASNTHEWCAEGISPEIENLQDIPLNSLPWWMDKLNQNEEIIIEDVALLPPEADKEKQFLEAQDIKSVLVLGVKIQGKLTGFIGFDFVKDFMNWSDSNIATLKVTAEVIGHALERARFRKALLHERDLLQALMDNIPDTIYFKDTKSRFTRINKAQAKVLGLGSTDEAVGKTDFDFFDEQHAQKAFSDEKMIFEKGVPVIGKLERFETDEVWRWMSATKVPITDENGSIIGLVGVSHDMTRQKEVEEKLRLRESFLFHLNEITNLSLKTTTTPELWDLLAGHIHKLLSSDICFITLWDEESRTLTPVSGSGISKESLKEFKVEPGQISMTESVLKAEKVLVAEDVFNSPYVSPGIAKRFPSKSLLGLPLIAYGQKYGAVLIGFTSKHKFTEEEIELGTLAANQIALVVARTRMLERLVENEKELRKLNAEKDKLFSVVAHDLRSPFTSFLGMTEMMSDESAALSMEEIREFAHAIRQSAGGLYQLLENLLEWSRMQGGYAEYNPEKQNLAEIIKGNISLLQAAANRKEISINNSIPHDLYVHADHKMLRSLGGNLISNAIKFTPRGGKVDISASVTGNQVQVEVKDTGVGMTEETLNKLFRIDMKVASQGTEGEASSGLGLILCKEFVEKHNGKIWVKSLPGKGSSFYFTLPHYDENLHETQA